jgi:hypothetical protein
MDGVEVCSVPNSNGSNEPYTTTQSLTISEGSSSVADTYDCALSTDTCFGGIWTCESCCNTNLASDGQTECWDGGVYTFENCCPSQESSCENIPGWDAGWGDCSTYAIE